MFTFTPMDRSAASATIKRIGALRSWLAATHPHSVVYEATGSYHKGVEGRYLGTHGLPVARLDARRARRFAEALGVTAKTDPVDARILAQFGAFLEPAATALTDPAVEQLKELVSARRGLVQRGTRVANRSKTATSPLLKRQLRQSGKQAKRQIEQIDAECHEIAMSDPELAQRLAILMSIPAVGKVTAMTLLAEMPELGNLNRQTGGQLDGSCPRGPRQRGVPRQAPYPGWPRTGSPGRLHGPLSSPRGFNADMKRKYQTLIDNGKPPKVALTAVMRKIIILANVLIRDIRTWSEVRPCL